jgi:hypothetical protein
LHFLTEMEQHEQEGDAEEQALQVGLEGKAKEFLE